MHTVDKPIRQSSLSIGVKLLLLIVGAEAVIMGCYQLLGVNADSTWAGIADALMLGLISSIVIYLWVVRPLKQAGQQNALFNTLVNNLDVGVVLTDPHRENHPIIYVNPAFTRITGYSANEAIGQNPRFLQGDDVDKAALQQAREAITEEKSVRVLQCNRRKDGSAFWNDLFLNPIFDRAGKVQYWVGLINDVSDAKALEKENRRWASAMQQSNEAVCVFDASGAIEYANRAFCNNVRLSPAEIIGRSVLPFWDQDSDAYSSLMACLQQAQPWSGRHKRYRADQTGYEALTSITPMHDEQAPLSFVAVHRDITDMAAMEAQLRQSQKMEAVGMLVGGIAHDFNNLLAGMLGNLYLVRKRLQDKPQLAERIASIEEQGYGAAGMVRQLLSFSRKDMHDVKEIDLVPFIKELGKFAQVSVPENIAFDCRAESGPLVVSCDPVQLQQSLLNLIVNATHALREKDDGSGKIEVRAGRIAPSAATPDTGLPPSDDRSAADEPHSWAAVSVRDNGIGMDQATREQIFEPFFTTKPSGVGTGLGLAMVKNYIEALGGVIEVESAPGAGTCMSIYLPLSVDKQVAAVEKDASLRPGRGELILLADDDLHVLDALSSILESANYRVVTAADGELAMAAFDKHADQLDMAIVDMVMPKASGLQAAEHMSQAHQNFPVALMTGYDKQGAMISQQDCHYAVLRKPWDIHQLNSVLGAALDSSDRLNAGNAPT